MSRRAVASYVGVATLLAVLIGLLAAPPASAGPWKGSDGTAAKAAAAESKTASVRTAGTSTWRSVRKSGPARTLVLDPQGRVRATLTDGARSVVLTGAMRTFREQTTSSTVTTDAYVRLLAAPFDGRLDLPLVQRLLEDSSPDVLATALQYVTGAGELRDADGAHLAADASFGPLVGGVRVEGSDWNDYYGRTATYPDGTSDGPEADQLRAVDCSGFVRLVFGARHGYPMTVRPDGVRLPRRAVQMAEQAPGVVVVADRGRQVTSFGGLLAGDLVLFDASTDDGTAVDHVGIYLGLDSAGHPRFVSSRKTVDGPTMGDVGGRSQLDGTGLYATSFRAVRRI